MRYFGLDFCRTGESQETAKISHFARGFLSLVCAPSVSDSRLQRWLVRLRSMLTA
jgi:hypothetical protein